MGYFNIQQQFLIPSFELDVKEQEKLDKYLLALEHSGVGDVLVKTKDKPIGFGGRPSFNKYRMFATILYSFAFGSGTLRDIEASCKYDLRYIYLMEQQQPTHMAFGTFINEYIVPNAEIIFSTITKEVLKECKIDLVDAFIDGTKIEADANKYKFVWKPTTWHTKLCDKTRNLLKVLNLERGIPDTGIFNSKLLAEKISIVSRLLYDCPDESKKALSEQYNQLTQYLEKCIEYEEKERICGPARNSYYKTDHDATAMCLKEDYYSGLGSNMHAAYNVQVVVIKGIACAYYVSQSRTDMNDFIPTIEAFSRFYGCYPKRICADSGYGCLQNYEYLYTHHIENYVKFQSWQGLISGNRPDTYRLNKDLTITCLNGMIGTQVSIPDRHPRNARAVFYKVTGCKTCEFSAYCKRYMKNKSENQKIFEVVVEFQKYKNQALENLLSPKGIELRVNRSSQNEGAIGVLKYDMNYARFRRISIIKVSSEYMLTYLGYNIRKLFRFFSGTAHFKYWTAPDDLQPEQIRQPSAKRLSKKATIRKKSVNDTAKSSYKYNRKKAASS